MPVYLYKQTRISLKIFNRFK